MTVILISTCSSIQIYAIVSLCTMIVMKVHIIITHCFIVGCTTEGASASVSAADNQAQNHVSPLTSTSGSSHDKTLFSHGPAIFPGFTAAYSDRTTVKYYLRLHHLLNACNSVHCLESPDGAVIWYP